jgi:protein-S-isoprenylcysteine O-methyltransferase Ste14
VRTSLQLAGGSLIGLAIFGLLLFLPAGTVDYWQAWVFIAVFTIFTIAPSIYLLVTDPAALQRRMQAGPAAETRTIQKIISTVALLSVAAILVFSVLDHRFGWSRVPAAASLVGDVLVALGLGVSMLVVIQNGHAAANVRVEESQSVVSTGLYGLVRHPMYVGNIILMVGIPLALGSYWALVIVIPGLLVLAVRILDEEKMLEHELKGYREYIQKVHYRLVPYVW